MKKSLLPILFILLLSLVLCACGGEEPQGGNELQPIGTAAPVPGPIQTPPPSGEVSDPVQNGDTPVSNETGDPSPLPSPSSGDISEPHDPVGTPIIPLRPQVSSSSNLTVN